MNRAIKRTLIAFFGFALLIGVPILLIVISIYLDELAKPRIVHGKKELKISEIKEIVCKYAPVIIQKIDKNKRQWDYICTVNFDGDWNSNNNSQNLQKKNISFKPAVYYSFFETESHFTILYSIFHPLVWQYNQGNYDQLYDNGFKHVQVIIKKVGSDEGYVSLLSIGRSEGFDFYKSLKSKFHIKNTKNNVKNLPLKHLGTDTVKDGDCHSVLLSQSGTHYLDVVNDMEPNIDSYVKYIPSFSLLNQLKEPKNSQKQTLEYALIDNKKVFWNADTKKLLFRKNFKYEDKLVKFSNVPLYFQGKQNEYMSDFSNIDVAPFAFGRPKNKSLASFFFNPVVAYSNLFQIKEDWSLCYIHYPFYSENER